MLALVKSREASGLMAKEIEYKDDLKPIEHAVIQKSAFKHIGRTGASDRFGKKSSSGFRNLR